MWNPIRFFPVIIKDQVEEDNQAWECYIKFFLLVERLSAPSFSNSDLTILELFIDEFFYIYLEGFPDTNLKPKAHF